MEPDSNLQNCLRLEIGPNLSQNSIFILNMAAHIRVNRCQRQMQVVPRPRLFRDRSNPLEDLPDIKIFRRF
jgi:hypothetical protein